MSVTTSTWTWVAETVDGEAIGELVEARERKLGFDLRGPATATFTLHGDSPLAGELQELAADLWIWHEKDLIFRGRIGSSDDDLDADDHVTSWSAVDYRGLLGVRITETPRSYEGAQQADIAWDLVRVAQEEGPGGWLGITRGDYSRVFSILRDEEFDADITIDAALSRFEDYADGFEWWLEPRGDGTVTFECATWRGVQRPDFPLA